MSQVENINSVKSYTRDICEKEDINNIYDECEEVIEIIYERNLYNGRSRDEMIAGIIYSISKKENLGISPEDVSTMFNIEKRSVILSSKYIRSNIKELNTLPQDWSVYLDSYCKSLNCDDKIRDRAVELGELGVKNCIHSGINPRSYAAGCIYAAYEVSNNLNIVTQRQLSNISGISKSSIRVSYNKLVNNYNNNNDI